jgi:HSP20 family protein
MPSLPAAQPELLRNEAWHGARSPIRTRLAVAAGLATGRYQDKEPVMALDDRETAWHPGEAERLLDEVARAFAGRRVTAFLGRSEPAVNVWVDDADAVVVTCEVPGVDPNRLGITVLGDILTVRGRRRSVDDGDEAEPGAGEISEFSRSLQLPFRVDPDRTEARVRDGVLEVSLHRPESEKPRRIAVHPA